MNKRSLRIAIIGAHWTGKTTLVKKLWYILKMPVIEEMARIVISEWNKLPHDMDDSERFVFQQTIFNRQIRHENELISFVSDRSVLDALVYAHGTPKISSLEREIVQCLIKTPYDFIFFIPQEFPLEFDGVRKEDEIYQSFIEKEFLRYLAKFKLPYVKITGSIDERIDKILWIIERKI